MLMGTCAFAVEDQEVTLGLIHKKIVQGEGNALGNGAGSSPRYSSTAMASQHETADRHTAECSADTVFFPSFLTSLI